MGDGSILGSMQGGSVVDPGSTDTSTLPFERNKAMLDDFAKRSALAEKDKSPIEELAASGAIKSLRYDKDGLTLSGLDPRLVIGMMEKSKRLDTIMGAMQQEGQRLQAQREKLDTTGGRIGNAVSVLAGNLASQKDMPGWVQGAGHAALQLNPTRDQVTAQQMQLGEQEAKIGESQQRLMEARLRAEEISSYRQAEHQRKEEADAAKKETAAAETARKKLADEEKARHDKEGERLRNLTRVLNEGKAAGGRISAKDIAGLNPDERAEVAAQMKGIRDNEAAKQEQKAALQKARLDAAKTRIDATNATKLATTNIVHMNQGAKEGLLAKVAAQIQKAEEAHTLHVIAAKDSFMTDDPKKVENMKLLQESEKSLQELRNQYDELKKKAQPSGPTMSSPEAAAKAKGNQDPLGLGVK